MCGIAGFCDFRADYTADKEREGRWTSVLIGMREAIAHRGKDQTGEYLRPWVGFSHTRLSIRDLALGIQPIVRERDGSEYVIVYNGEIYNAEELTGELKRAGYRFDTTTDTEVILYAYMEYGKNCAKRLNGIYAFAIWDGLKEELLLFRDRAGVKPLFYTLQGSALIFGSEIKALFAHPDVQPKLGLDGLREVIGIGPARTEGCGVFEGIREVKAGEYAVWNRDGLREEAYWQIESKPHTDSYRDTVDTVSFLVRDAITRQMISDVPVCSFLSGGIDSSIVTAVASDFMNRSGARLNTFSFDFSGNDRYFSSNAFQPARDRPYVDIMLNHLTVCHTYLECDEENLADLLPEAMRAKDLPGMADVDASLLYFCKLVKEKNKVALTGECADEIFGGYPWFYREELLQGKGFPWSKNPDVRGCLLRDELLRELDLEDYVAVRYEQSLRQVPRLYGEPPEEARRREIAYLNLKWFMQTLLDRMDRTSMHSGLEARVPFADHRIIEYVFNVPWEMKYQNGVEKALLRDACGDLLPAELRLRKKSPYPKTYNPNYERLLKDRLSSLLTDPEAPVRAFLDEGKVRRFLETPSEYGKPWFGQLMAGPQLIAYTLQIDAWLRQYRPELIA